MFAVRNPAGRLVTFRVTPPVDDANAGTAAEQLRGAVVAVGRPTVVCADLTEARPLAETTTERFVTLMKWDNPLIERTALLLSGSATLALQVERMLREADNSSRRAFRHARTLREWLAPCLSPAEDASLAAFLGVALP